MKYNKKIKKTTAFLMAFSLIALSMLTACQGKKQTTTELVRDGIWEEMDKLQGISPDDIDSVDFMFLTEGGGIAGKTSDKDEIKAIYNNLTAITLKEPTMMCVDDDGLVVTVTVGEDKMSFSFEHDILVESNNDRYLVEGMGPLKVYLQGLVSEE